MKRTGPSLELKALTRSIKEVENRFLRPHLLPTTLGAPSKQEVLDVAAYVVLVPSDPVLTASLEFLITMRHQWAHHDHRRAKILKSAKDAQTTVSDCLTLAKKLSAGAATVKP